MNEFLSFTFKVVNLRLECLFPGPMSPQDSHYLVVAAISGGSLCLALLERGQEGCEIKTGYGNYMRRMLQRD
jgi:hypothetical protein